MSKKRLILILFLIVSTISLLTACQPAEVTPETITIIETVIVEGTPQVIEKEVQVTVAVTAVPEEPAEEVGEESDRQGGVFTWGMPDEFPGFNPILNNNYTELWLFGLTSEPLTWGGENYPTELKPILAESWEVSEDGLVWTIHLRQGVVWHDGVEFTADDVVFWANAIQDPETGEGAAWWRPRFETAGVPHTFEAVDKYTVQVTTAEPIPSLLNQICVPLIPKHYFEENGVSNADMANDPFNTEINIGTGPFKMVEYRRGEAAVLEANPDYWRGKPYLDTVVLRVIPDPTAMLAAVQSGEVDWAQVEPQYVPQLLQNPNIELHILKMDSFRALEFNVKKPMFADKRVRQAFMHAVDRQSVINAYVMGYGEIPDYPFTHVVYGYEPLPQYEYDPDKALELLAEVGWVEGPNGTLVAENVEGVPAGTPFEFTLDTPPRYQAIGTVVQANLADIGVKANMLIQDYPTWLAENLGKEDKPYDVVVGGGGWLGSDGAGYSWAYYAGSATNSQMSYYNPEVEGLWAQVTATDDKEVKGELLREIAVILWDELPMAPLLWQNWVFAANPKVHVEETELNPNLFALFAKPETIWIEK
ncbi:MAG: ABC transporter substrate-binding protein [Anaerolineales bacterium]|nr:ABC transporter substrate-binding protein [Anaerolineales bacterium]